MALVFLDLDKTLIQGDSDYLWGEFLFSQGLIDKAEYQKNNLKFYQDYQQGVLDHDEYLRFALTPFAKHQTEELLSLNHEFVENVIRPIIYKETYTLIQQHKKRKDRVIIHSATNSFVVSPIAHLLGISDVISTRLEIIGEQYTGKYIGLANYGQNKVENTYRWLKEKKLSNAALKDCCAYSDSFNDLPLLKIAHHPFAVNPDAKLRDYATNHDWKILDFEQQELE